MFKRNKRPHRIKLLPDQRVTMVRIVVREVTGSIPEKLTVPTWLHKAL